MLIFDHDFTSQLIEKLGGARWSQFEDTTRSAAIRHLLDSVGLIYAGAREPVTDIAETALSAVRAPGILPVPGRMRRADVVDATYLMAIASHCLEFDDGYRPGAAHPGSIVIPAALAVGGFVQASGRSMLESVVAGYEVMTNVARLAQPALRKRGFHATAAVGVFAAAAAAGHLLKLEEDQLRSAFGLAASSAGGLFAFSQGGEDVKPLHVGHAAREGVLAALLAWKGADGPPYGIEGPKGFLEVLAGMSAGGMPVTAGWEITECYIKPWPGCRHLQSAIDCVLQLRREYSFAGEDIQSVDVETYGVAAERATTPWVTSSSALLSFPFVLSTAILFGDVTLEHFDEEARTNPAVDAMAQRLTVRSSEGMDEAYRRGNPARVTIVLKDGRRLARETEHAPGSPAMPMNEEALAAKFLHLVSRVTERANADVIYRAWSEVCDVENVGSLLGIPL